MLAEIRAIQLEMGTSDAELLKLAREVAGCGRVRCLEDLISVERFELLEEMQGIRERASVEV